MGLKTKSGMGLEFNKTTDYPRGLILDLLQDAYSFDSRYEQHWIANWQEADSFMFDNPIIAEKYSFVSTLDGEPIGFIVWDPRNIPAYAELGHNCIRSLHKGKHYGNQQLREAIRRISEVGTRKIIVTTNEGLVPAQRNYENVGFQLIRKRINEDNPECAGQYMDYELLCNQNS